ncbi:MAG: 5-oxoprolinase subunit PxpA [Cyclobacteriaceae bacterium]
MSHLSVDINCDMGESYGRFRVGNDEAIFPYISSCNIACGFHGGDPLHIERTIQLAQQYDVQIGAHPSYPDLSGFGRRKMEIPLEELKALVKYQISAVKGLAESHGVPLKYVKPHGALYNTVAKSEAESRAIIEAVREISGDLILLGLAGSVTAELSIKMDQPFAAEAFADRKYESDGSLRSRNLEGAVLTDPEKAAQQVLSIIKDEKVIAYNGDSVSIKADSICIHGDNTNAVHILQSISESLDAEGIMKKSFVS